MQIEVVGEVGSWAEQGNKPNYKDIRGKKEDLEVYAQIFEALEVKEDILYYPILLNDANPKRTYRIVMLESDHDAAFYWSHQSPTAGHFGQTATVQRAKTNFLSGYEL